VLTYVEYLARKIGIWRRYWHKAEMASVAIDLRRTKEEPDNSVSARRKIVGRSGTLVPHREAAR